MPSLNHTQILVICVLVLYLSAITYISYRVTPYFAATWPSYTLAQKSRYMLRQLCYYLLVAMFPFYQWADWLDASATNFATFSLDYHRNLTEIYWLANGAILFLFLVLSIWDWKLPVGEVHSLFNPMLFEKADWKRRILRYNGFGAVFVVTVFVSMIVLGYGINHHENVRLQKLMSQMDAQYLKQTPKLPKIIQNPKP